MSRHHPSPGLYHQAEQSHAETETATETGLYRIQPTIGVVFAKWGRYKALTKMFDKLEGDCLVHIKTDIENAKKGHAKFGLSGDSWKTKGKRRRHFHAMFVQWVDNDMNVQQACIGAVELKHPIDNVEYQKRTEELMDRVGLKMNDIKAVVTDHDGTIRKAYNEMKFTMVGCGCHLVQTVVKHVLPPLHKKKKTKAQKQLEKDEKNKTKKKKMKVKLKKKLKEKLKAKKKKKKAPAA